MMGWGRLACIRAILGPLGNLGRLRRFAQASLAPTLHC